MRAARSTRGERDMRHTLTAPLTPGLNECRFPNALAQHRRGAAPRADRDAAAARQLRSVGTQLGLGALEHRAQDDLHLEHGEARPDAAPAAAAERDPGVGAGA